TQQLAKNFFLSRSRNMMRKLQEVMLSLWLEHKFTKDELLELYLNRVYFGAGAYGVEAAAQRYFGKSARNVSLSEAALALGPSIVKASGAGSSNYVADWVMDVLNDAVGLVDEDIVVETTIDPALQEAA